MNQVSVTHRSPFLFFVLIIHIHHAVVTADELLNTTTIISVISINQNKDDNPSKFTSNVSPLLYEVSTNSTSLQKVDDAQSSESIVSERYENPPNNYDVYSTSDEEPDGPEDHVIPYSEHEEPKDVPTRPKYSVPGEWANPNNKDVPLEFVPTKLYAQVRGTHTVKRLPRKEAVENANTEEERENAPRLREVVTNSKVNTVYTEEGYEDSAYDHAGHVRDADFHEGFARKLHEQLDEKQKSADEKRAEPKEHGIRDDIYKINSKEFQDYDDDYRDHYEEVPTNLAKVTNKNNYNQNERSTAWINPEIHPKFVTQDGVERLQLDLEKEVEEIERNAKIDKAQKELVSNEPQDFKDDTTEIGEEHQNYGYQDQNNQSSRSRTKKRKPTIKIVPTESTYVNPARRKTIDLETKQNSNIVTEMYETTIIPDKKEIISTDRSTHETITDTVTDSLRSAAKESYKDTPHYNSLSSANIFSKTAVDEPTTISYSQLFWDFFKSRQKDLTKKQDSSNQETTTANSQFVKETVPRTNGHQPYYFSTEQETTALPLINIDRETSRPQYLFPTLNSAGQGFSVYDKNYVHRPSKETNSNNYIQTVGHLVTQAPPGYNRISLTSKESATNESRQPSTIQDIPEHSASPVTLYTEISSHSPLVLTTDFQSTTKNIENGEVSVDHGLNQPAKSTAHNSYVIAKRKPPYKVLVRHKPTKYIKPIGRESNTNEVTTSKVLNEKTYHNELTGTIKPSNNYYKMLSYLNNEDNRARHNLSGKRRGNDLTSTYKKNDTENLMTHAQLPPSPMKEITYINYSRERPRSGLIAINQPSVTIESKAQRETNWKKIPLLQDQIYLRSNRLLKSSVNYPDRFAITQTMNSKNQRVSIPATRLLPPAPLLDSDYARYQIDNEGEDRLIYSKTSPEYVYETLSYAPLSHDSLRQIRASERKRRFARRESDDEIVKAAILVINNGTSNWTNSERIRRNSNSRRTTKIKRNLPRRIIRELEMENVPDMSSLRTKQAIEKKSRSYPNANDRLELSHESLHKQNDVINVNGESNWTFNKQNKKASKEDNGEILKNNTKNVEQHMKVDAKFKRSKRETKSQLNPVSDEWSKKTIRKSHEQLLNEAPKITNEVIENEINARFNKNKIEEPNEKSYDKNEEKVQVEVPDFDYVEELLEEEHPTVSDTTEPILDLKKYPFYKDDKIPKMSVLKYITDPQKIPKKTVGGMEFYDSRDAYKQCDEIEPSLDEVLPEKEEPVPNRGLNENLPRLRGLGDKLDCYKAKYFDENPFDNPLFSEKQIGDPIQPSELNPKQFSSRIMFLPKENDDYVVQKLSKRPETLRSRTRKPNVRDPTNPYTTDESIRFDNRQNPQAGKGRNDYLHRIRSSRKPPVSHRQAYKKHQGNKRRPISAPSETLFASTTPYENQVYEDVMGNIMANSYKVYEGNVEESPTHIMTGPSNKDKQKVVAIPSETLKIESSRIPSINISRHPSHISILNVDGLVPLQYHRRRPTIYRRNRTTQKNVSRKERPLSTPRIFGHYQKIHIHKRSIRSTRRDDLPIKLPGPIILNVTQNNTVKSIKRNENTEAGYGPDLTVDGTVIVPTRKNVNHSSIHLKADSMWRKTNTENISSVSTNVNKEPDNEETERVVYTIKDRIRYSKPKEDIRRVGKFVTNETTLEEDHRRKEPRYNIIKRKKVHKSSTPVSTPVFLPNSTNTSALFPSTTNGPSLETSYKKVDKQESLRETQETLLSTEMSALEILTSSEKPETTSINDSFEHFKVKLEASTTEKPMSGYAVYENIEENVPTTITPKATTIPEFIDLKTYLEFDPLSYIKSSEEVTDSSSKSIESNSNGSTVTPNNNFQFNGEKAEKEYDNFKKFRHSYVSNEESSEKVKEEGKDISKEKSEEENKESSNENEKSKENQSQFTFSSRPISPAENYEDKKYSDLGPRINKPAFYHPPFVMSDYKEQSRTNSEDYSDNPSDDKESDEDKSKKEEAKHVFPWYRDEAETRDSKYRLFEKYEFPWEKRERLAREKRKKEREEYERLKEIFGETDDDVVTTKDHKRHAYPWDKYDQLESNTRKRQNVWNANDSSNKETNEEQRPIMKYSSRYNSKTTKLRTDDKPIRETTSSIDEISQSIKKILEDDSKDKSISIETDDDASHTKIKTSTNKTRGISRSMIVPEDVTLAPRKRNERKKSSRPIKLEKTELTSKRNERNKDQSANSSNVNYGNSNKLGSHNPLVVTRINKIGPTKQLNSTTQSDSRRKRKPSKNSIANIETTTTSVVETTSKSRRRQRILGKTVISSTPTNVLTTPTPTVSRRRIQRPTAETTKEKIIEVSSTGKLKRQKVEEIENSTPRNRLNEGRSKTSNSKVIAGPNFSKEGEVKTSSYDTAKARNSLPKTSRGRRKQLEKKNTDDEGSIIKNASTEKTFTRNGGHTKKNNEETLKTTSSPVTPNDDFSSELEAAKSFNFKDDIVKKTGDDFGIFDDIPDDQEDDRDFGSVSKPDTYLPDNLLQSVSLLTAKKAQRIHKDERELDNLKSTTNKKLYHNSYDEIKKEQKEQEKQVEKEEQEDDSKQIETRAKFIKDPKQRLYYYIER